MTAAVFLGVMMLLASDTAIGRSMRYWLMDDLLRGSHGSRPASYCC